MYFQVVLNLSLFRRNERDLMNSIYSTPDIALIVDGFLMIILNIAFAYIITSVEAMNAIAKENAHERAFSWFANHPSVQLVLNAEVAKLLSDWH